MQRHQLVRQLICEAKRLARHKVLLGADRLGMEIWMFHCLEQIHFMVDLGLGPQHHRFQQSSCCVEWLSVARDWHVFLVSQPR